MKFKEWFEAQHGKRPTNIPLCDLEDEVQKAQYSLRAAQALLHACDIWEARFQSALYAWQIKDEKKK